MTADRWAAGGFRRALFRALPGLGVSGLAGLCATALLGFESPNAVLLALSGAALLVPPLAVLLDLWLGREMAEAERRRWLSRLTGRQAFGALEEYIAERAR